MRKLTNEEFVEKLNEVNPFIEPLEQYTNKRTKMWFKCLKNKEHENWQTTPNTILYGGTGCPCCGKENTGKALSIRKRESTVKINETDSKIKEYLTNKEDGDFYGCYSRGSTSFTCNICNHVFTRSILYMSNCLDKGYFPCPMCG